MDFGCNRVHNGNHKDVGHNSAHLKDKSLATVTIHSSFTPCLPPRCHIPARLNTPATRFTSDLLIYATMSLSKNPQQMQSKPDPSTPRPPSSASGAVVPGSKLDQAIQDARAELEDNFRAELDDNRIRKRLGIAWFIVGNAIEEAEDSKLKKSLKDKSEFFSYVSPGSDNERELINLLRSMAAQEVPWSDLFKSEAFIKPEKQDTKNTSMDLATRLAWDSEYKGDLPGYETLLDRSLALHDAFELKDVLQIGKKAKKSRGARRRQMVPLAYPEHAHHRIHRVKPERSGRLDHSDSEQVRHVAAAGRSIGVNPRPRP
ncbi:hypothetical protein BGY98DRAFT_558024 [Russula aff. rugulosa BPL654]|nr:hypothetical protein BGY98DRAFT_558024 [Russula aff. rugulosa BPL654]